MKITRRLVLASAVPALAAAQANPAPAAGSPDFLAISASQYAANAQAMAKVVVPMETEPAFHFKP